jgi:hypothetical protein
MKILDFQILKIILKILKEEWIFLLRGDFRQGKIRPEQNFWYSFRDIEKFFDYLHTLDFSKFRMCKYTVRTFDYI